MNKRKGVIKIVPDEDMPYDENGVRADVCIFSKGIIARTNNGKLYEMYFGSSSRQMKSKIMDLLSVKNSTEIAQKSKTEISTVFDYLIKYLSLFNTIQYKLYAGLYRDGQFIEPTNIQLTSSLSLEEKVEILTEIYDKELYLTYNVQEEESAYDIVNRLEASEFKLKVTKVFVKDPFTGMFKPIKGEAIISPLYMVMLNKITDSFLGASTFFINGYGLPTGKSKEDGRFNYKFKMVRGFGESELRLLAAYGSGKLIQSIMDRSRSIENHRLWYRNMLLEGGVNNPNLLEGRLEDTDMAINLVKAVNEPAGITISTRSR